MTATHPDALAALDDAEAEVWQQHYAPPPVLSLSEWADRYRIISEPAPEPGRWRTDRAPYLKEPMDMVSELGVEEVVLMWASQTGKTEIIHNTIGYHIHMDPCAMLVVRQTENEAKAWSKERLAPMIRDCDVLRSKVKEARSRDSENTILNKSYPGGWMAIVGSNSASGLVSKPVKVLVVDEWDRFEASAGGEGDPVALAEVRQRNYRGRRKRLKVSSPGLKGLSKTEEGFKAGDQRRYHVPCPECNVKRPLNFWRPKENNPDLGHLHWEDGKPETACYCCGECGALIAERAKRWMLENGEWVAENPGGLYPSYQLSALYSPWMTWEEVAIEWYKAQGDSTKLQVFVNTVLAETWEERAGAGTTSEGIISRREAYRTTVPEGVQVLTMGVDVQENRIEVLVIGWGWQWESWRIAREILIGDPTQAEVWAKLDEVHRRVWQGPDGKEFRIYAGCVDSGYLSTEVYMWTKPRFGQRVYATKGASDPAAPLVTPKPSNRNQLRAPVFSVGTKAVKDSVYGRLRIQQPGPGYMHMAEWVDEDYADQVTAEKKVPAMHRGRRVVTYVLPSGRRNEMLDCEGLAYVPLHITRWKPKPPKSDQPPPEPDQTEPKGPVEDVIRWKKKAQGRRKNWVKDWRW